jgi:hypothetical protein
MLNSFRKWVIWGDTRGQDLIEYALLASFLVFSTVAVVPDVISKVSTVMVAVYSNICLAGGSCPAPTNNTNNNNHDHDNDQH